MHLHEVEQRETAFTPRMWDATPDVCCAYLQTGACAHTEGYDPADDDLEPVSTGADEVRYAVEGDDEPF